MAQRARPIKPFMHQGQSNAPILPERMHCQGAKQEGIGSGCPNFYRPEADRAGEANFAIAHREGKLFGRLRALAQAVGSLGAARQAKAEIEQMLDQGLIGRRKVVDGKRRGGHWQVHTKIGKECDPWLRKT